MAAKRDFLTTTIRVAEELARVAKRLVRSLVRLRTMTAHDPAAEPRSPRRPDPRAVTPERKAQRDAALSKARAAAKAKRENTDLFAQWVAGRTPPAAPPKPPPAPPGETRHNPDLDDAFL